MHQQVLSRLLPDPIMHHMEVKIVAVPVQVNRGEFLVLAAKAAYRQAPAENFLLFAVKM